MFLAMHLAGNSLVNIFLLQRKKRRREMRLNLNFSENHTRIHFFMIFVVHSFFIFHKEILNNQSILYCTCSNRLLYNSIKEISTEFYEMQRIQEKLRKRQEELERKRQERQESKLVLEQTEENSASFQKHFQSLQKSMKSSPVEFINRHRI